MSSWVKCADCRHFKRDQIGDGAGIGLCGKFKTHTRYSGYSHKGLLEWAIVGLEKWAYAQRYCTGHDAMLKGERGAKSLNITEPSSGCEARTNNNLGD